MPTLLFQRIHPEQDADILLPSYATEDSSGLDLRINQAITLAPGERLLAPTGLSVEIPRGHEGQIRPRSGIAFKHGVTCLNTPGTIDADYRGELKILLINLGSESVRFERGTRVAQMVIAKYEKVTIEEAVELAETQRADGGFGHSGLH